MSDLNVIVFTMKGCSHCSDFKKMLIEKNIDFFDRDIDEYEEEYKLFIEVTDNQFIPALLIIEGTDENYHSYVYAPERDYNTLEEAISIIENHTSGKKSI